MTTLIILLVGGICFALVVCGLTRTPNKPTHAPEPEPPKPEPVDDRPVGPIVAKLAELVEAGDIASHGGGLITSYYKFALKEDLSVALTASYENDRAEVERHIHGLAGDKFPRLWEVPYRWYYSYKIGNGPTEECNKNESDRLEAAFSFYHDHQKRNQDAERERLVSKLLAYEPKNQFTK